jgi:hypothetical protein
MIVPPPPDPTEWERDARLPTLRIDLKSIEVRVVEAVKFNTTPHLVHRIDGSGWRTRRFENRRTGQN